MDRRTLIAALGTAALMPALPGLQPVPARAQAAPARAPVAPVRILVFGDSLVAGYGLRPEQSIVPTLGRWLAANGAPEVRLTNSGVSGDTTYGGRVRIGWALRRAAFDAVIVELGANDMLLGFDPQKSARNLEAIIASAGAGGRPVLLAGIGAVGRSPAYRAAWDAMWPQVAARTGALLVPNLYATIQSQPAAARRAFLQADNLHASPKGVGSIVDLLGPKVLEMVARVHARAG